MMPACGARERRRNSGRRRDAWERKIWKEKNERNANIRKGHFYNHDGDDEVVEKMKIREKTKDIRIM